MFLHLIYVSLLNIVREACQLRSLSSSPSPLPPNHHYSLDVTPIQLNQLFSTVFSSLSCFNLTATPKQYFSDLTFAD
jgi:hypothetical protein